MVLIMRMHVRGACRRNGQPNAIGVALCYILGKTPKQNRSERPKKIWSTETQEVTNSRADLEAIIAALEKTLSRSAKVEYKIKMNVKIYSDSEYAVNCMNAYERSWFLNPFMDKTGRLLDNRDLLRRAYAIIDHFVDEDDLEFIYLPSEEIQITDQALTGQLNTM